MTDIVERLRRLEKRLWDFERDVAANVAEEAATTIETLRAQLAEADNCINMLMRQNGSPEKAAKLAAQALARHAARKEAR